MPRELPPRQSQVGPKSVQTWPTSTELRRWPNTPISANMDLNSVETWLAQNRPKLLDIGPNAYCATSATIGPKSVQLWSNSVRRARPKVGQPRPQLGQHQPRLGRRRPKLGPRPSNARATTSWLPGGRKLLRSYVWKASRSLGRCVQIIARNSFSTKSFDVSWAGRHAHAAAIQVGLRHLFSLGKINTHTLPQPHRRRGRIRARKLRGRSRAPNFV